MEELEELLTEYFSGKLSEAGAQRLNELLQSDPLFQKRFEEMAKVRAKLFTPRFEQEKQANYEALKARLNLPVSRNRRWLMGSKQWGFWAAAACLCVLLLSFTAYYFSRRPIAAEDPLPLYALQVPFGSRNKVQLPDGTTVYLNSGSMLEYSKSFSRHVTREVYLTGEGYFKVTKNAGKPFIVHTQELSIKVLGTVFNVRSYADDSVVRVTLLQGRVNISIPSAGDSSICLLPHEEATYQRSNHLFQKGEADVERAVSWLNGRMELSDASFGELVKEIERVYGVKFRIESRKAGKEEFTGSIDSRLPIDEVLQYIDVDHKYKWVHRGDTIILQDKR